LDVAGNIAASALLIERTPPVLQVLDERGDLIEEGGFTPTASIKASANDPPAAAIPAAGLGLFELFRGDPTSTVAIASYNAPFAAPHTYASTDPGLSVLDNLPDGLIFVRVSDRAGNKSTRKFTVDRTEPQLDMTDDAGKLMAENDVTATGRVTLTANDQYLTGPGTGTGIVKLTLKKVGGGYSEERTFPAVDAATATFPLGGGPLAEGHYGATAVDGVGNESSSFFAIDRSTPLVTLNFATLSGGRRETVTAARTSFNTASDRISITFQCPSGVKSVTITKAGAQVAQQLYDPLQRQQADINLPLPIADGTYQVAVLGTFGLQTLAEIVKYTFTAEVSVGDSSADYVSGAGFTSRLKVKVNNTGPGVTSLDVYKTKKNEAGAHLAEGPPIMTTGAGSNGLITLGPLSQGTYQLVAKDAYDQAEVGVDLTAANGFFKQKFDAFSSENINFCDTTGDCLSLALQGNDFAASGHIITQPADLIGGQSGNTTVTVPRRAIGAALVELERTFFDIGGGLDNTGNTDNADTGLSVKYEIASGATIPGTGFSPVRVVRLFTGASQDALYEYRHEDTLPVPLKRFAQLKITLTPNSVLFRHEQPRRISPGVGSTTFKPLYAVADLLQGAGAVYKIQTPADLNGRSIAKFTSTIPGLTIAQVPDPVAPPGKTGVGSAVLIDPILVFNNPATLIMTFSSQTALAANLDLESLAIYESRAAGLPFTRLPEQLLDLSTYSVAAFLSQIHLDATYAVFGATTTAFAGGLGLPGTGLALAADQDGNLWQVTKDAAGLSLFKFRPGAGGPAFLNRTGLPEATDQGDWSIRFDAAGNAFAVGTASGPGTVGVDVAVYKVGA
ncbi:MAG: hypothetical protein AAB065_08160, partial [Deltaproteobacteria bacterium]